MVKKMEIMCDYGCGQEAKFQLKNKKICCCESWNSCPVNRKKNSDSLTGSKNPMFGKKRPDQSKRMKDGGASYVSSFVTKESRKRVAARMRKQIKNPSDPELKLRKIVKELYPTSEHTYSILNYDVDITLPEFKIAIEYDGWYHFNTEEHKEYHKKRQQEIEEDGWKFLRYNIFYPFPTLEQVKEDIKKVLEC